MRPAPRDRVVKRHARAGDRRAARAAIGLDHVAIDAQCAFAERLEIGDRAQAPADQTLNLLRAAGLPAFRRLAPRAGVGRAGQHAVLGGDPALPTTPEERRHVGLDTDGAHHAGFAALDQHGTLGMTRVMTTDAHRSQLVGAAAGSACACFLAHGRRIIAARPAEPSADVLVPPGCCREQALIQRERWRPARKAAKAQRVDFE